MDDYGIATISRYRLITTLAIAVLVGCNESQPQGRIVDDHDLLSDAAERRIGAFQSVLLDEYNIDLALSIPESSPPDLARYAHDTSERMEIGRTTSEARGVLLVVDADGGMVRMEVGPGLEHVFPDLFVGRIERDQMAPFFAREQIADGVEATVELLVSRVREAIREGDDDQSESAPREEDDLAGRDFSAGAGAQQAAPIGDEGRLTSAPATPNVSAQASPAEALSAYLEILARDDRSTNHSLYTPSTRRFLSNRVLTRAQMRNEHRLLFGAISSARFVEADSLAVAFFDDRTDIPPYFLARSNEGWMLDLAQSSRAIRFDLKNNWFYTGDAGSYEFAFPNGSTN
ncbi:MAG: TPM domain-containing protein [Rhodothermia bacterium]|nr:TPM domain-containing protein [Rhodothermia bacterium]